MPKISITIAQLIREEATIVVDVPSKEILEGSLKEVYDAEGGEANWTPDPHWIEEGTHSMGEEVEDSAYAHFTMSETGEVSANPEPAPEEQG